MIEDTFDILRRLITRSDARDKASSLLDIVSDLIGIEGNKRIEVGKEDNTKEIENNRQNTRLLCIDIEVKINPLSYLTHKTRWHTELHHYLREKIGK